MIILSIETSCDETAVAIVKFEKNKAEVMANIVSSQIKTHSKYGGVVPSLAARMHLKNMVPVLRRALGKANINQGKIDFIAVTNGPGLIPALIIGVGAAKALAYSLEKPLVSVNHLEGHIYANWLRPVGKNPKFQTNSKFPAQGWSASGGKIQNSILWQPEFPILCLIVSGGHTQLILMKKDLSYKIIGETMDDAAGEAFDKVAKLLGLGYPGGPMIEKMAKKGDKNKFNFPRPMMSGNDFNFSFSGLKTAVLYKWNLEFGIWNLEDKKEKMKSKNSDVDFNSAKSHPDFHQDSKFKSDIAASFQQAVIDVLVSKTIRAAKEYKVKNIILGGGVSANRELQKQLRQAINKEIPNSKFQIPNSNLSTDNALMIAIAAYYNIIGGKNVRSWKNIKADANLRL